MFITWEKIFQEVFNQRFLFWNGNFNIIIDHIKKGKLKMIIFASFLDTAAGKTQLEQEFNQKSWELFDFNPNSDIFKSNPSNMGKVLKYNWWRLFSLV